MPVDKFGHTDSSSVQRVVVGGVTLTQINNAFVRLDGTNVLTGNLNMGGNAIEGLSNGLRVRINDEAAFEIIKNAEDLVGRINVHKDIYMYGCRITGLAEPTGDGSAATKKYVDNSLKKCLVGYIPNLGANNSRKTGFIASASSTTRAEGYEAYRAFNNIEADNYWASDARNLTDWLQIRCPEPVIIWKLALKLGTDIVDDWSLTASNDGITFTTLSGPNGRFRERAIPDFFNISTTTAYQYYRVTLTNTELTRHGIEVMQLYVYDT